jgi:hypothetical protein
MLKRSSKAAVCHHLAGVAVFLVTDQPNHSMQKCIITSCRMVFADRQQVCGYALRRVSLGCRDSDAASREELVSVARYIPYLLAYKTPLCGPCETNALS